MSYAAALSSAVAIIDAVPEKGLANGAPYINASMPANSHIVPALVWPLQNDGDNATLESHICAYAGVDRDSAQLQAATGFVDVELAVVVAIARCAAWRFFGWSEACLNPVECTVAAPNAPALTVHPDHQDAVEQALTAWSTVAARYMGLAVYNAISYETSNHHHLPAVTKKLATTTVAMTGLSDWMALVQTRESAVFHDMFHPLSDVTKSILARDVKSKPMLTGVKLDNLRKRLPVKAAGTGIAINYEALVTRARSYRHNPVDLPPGLDAPANLLGARAAYIAAATAADVVVAVDKLREIAEALAEPSAYLVGFILGREAATANDPELALRTAKRTVTILGSPAYERVAAEHSGTFAAGKEAGLRAVPATVADQVLPRVVGDVAYAASL